LHALGFRYRLHDERLPGRPDIVLRRYKAVILVHGCFWHGHGCPNFRWPKSREAFWRAKIAGNKERDARTGQELSKAGWRILRVWECSLKGRGKLGVEKVIAGAVDWLRSDRSLGEIRGTHANDGTDRLA
jgi:DNA mismatch endonuclease (patch repair protein)